MHGVRPVLIDVLAACVLTFAAVVARLALEPLIGSRHPYALFYVALVGAVLWRGMRTAVIVAAIGAIAGTLFAQGANWSSVRFGRADLVSIVPYLVVAAAILAVAGRFRALTETTRRAQERYRTLVELSPDAVAVSDSSGRLLLANDTMARLLGVADAGSLRGMSLPDLVRERERETLIARTRRTLETGEPNPPHMFHVHKPGGGELIAEVTSGRVRWDDDWAVMSVSRDLTARIQAESRAERLNVLLRALMDSNVFGVLVGRGDVLQLGNSEMLRMLGRTNEELARGHVTWVGITPQDQMDVHEEAMHDLREYGRTLRPREKDVLRADGSRVPILLGGALVDRGTFEWICFGLDLTEQREYERKLEEANEDLRHFADAVGHDLREPLRGMSNFAGFLYEDHARELSPDAVDKVETIRALAARLSDLIDDLLNYAHAGRGAMELEPIDPGQIAQSAAQSVRDFLMRRAARVWVQPAMPRVNADAMLLTLVFQNLIVNAVKYNTAEAPTVEVGWEDGHLFVRDNGIGIPERYHDRIFEPFRRLHARDRFGGGSGIGLAIVKKIVERHGGRVWVKSEPGKGSTFCIELSRIDPPPAFRADAGRGAAGEREDACPEPPARPREEEQSRAWTRRGEI